MPTVRDFAEKINIRGELAFEEPLARHTSFRIGGPAELLAAPADAEELVRVFRAARESGIPVFVLGGGANLLVGDRGMRGLVLSTRLLAEIAPGPGPDSLRAEAGASVDALCEAAREAGLAGLETFYGMPGSVGGSAFMNARCYEVEMADRLSALELLLPDGRLRTCALDPAEWSYKRSPLQPGGSRAGAIVLAARFALRPGDPAAIGAVMAEKRADREAKGHYRLPSAGSVFKNDRSLGRPSGKILDELGFRGRRIGGAMVSEWHANIFVNAGGARASEVLALVEAARAEAKARLGVELEPEVLAVGDF